jgi:hypothetical protein
MRVIQNAKVHFVDKMQISLVLGLLGRIAITVLRIPTFSK